MNGGHEWSSWTNNPNRIPNKTRPVYKNMDQERNGIESSTDAPKNKNNDKKQNKSNKQN